MPEAAKVDVAVTVYRRPTYVREAVESVLTQTFGNWRLRICENGPGGGAIEDAIRPYLSDPRVSYLTTGTEISMAENWTRAIGLGDAPYVALLHDDDRWHPDYLGARVEALDAHPECGFVFAEWVLVDEGGNETFRAPLRFPEGVVERGVLAEHLIRENIVLVPAALVRRSAYETVGASFDGAWHYCDWEMWARLAARFPAYYLARQDNDFRRHAQANTFLARESPDQLLAMLAHVERLFLEALPSFRLSRPARRRNRSRALLHAAADVHRSGGWRVSGGLYARAVRTYPPTIAARSSLTMLSQTVLGRRGTQAVRGVLHARRRGGSPEAPGSQVP